MSSHPRAIKLQEQHLRLIYDDFRLLDDDRDGYIDQSQYATLVRALGQTVSDLEIERTWKIAMEEQEKVNAEERNAAAAIASKKKSDESRKSLGIPAKPSSSSPPMPRVPPGNSVGFQVFTRVFSENYMPPETERTLLEAFRLFDSSNTGKMSVQQLQELVMTRGEPLPRSEFEELLLLAGLDGSKTFDYSQLVKRLITGPAGLAIINTR